MVLSCTRQKGGDCVGGVSSLSSVALVDEAAALRLGGACEVAQREIVELKKLVPNRLERFPDGFAPFFVIAQFQNSIRIRPPMTVGR